MKNKNENTLILTGGGESKYFKEIDLKFKSLLPSKCNILLIPLASNRKNHSAILKRIKQTFNVLRFNNISICQDLTKINWDYLSLFHAIYIDGGNTFTLMKLLQERKVKSLFRRYLKEGGIINGDSAGAIVLGKKVDSAYFGTSKDKNFAGLKDYTGLNFIFNWYIHCHYDVSEDKQIFDYVKSGKKLIALSEKSAVFIKGNKLKVIGKHSAYIFTKNKKLEIKQNKQIKLNEI